MPKDKKQKNIDLADVWARRVENAKKYYDNWARKFMVADLEEAYYGFQWEDCEHEEEDYREYVMNMIFSSIDVKIPNLLFKHPTYRVKAKPAKIDFDPSQAAMRARLKEDVLNQLVSGGIKHFSSEVELCILDAFFRFGILEVGYAADYILNPDAGKPFMVSDTTMLMDNTGKVIRQPEVITDEEKIFVRRIPAERFRVGGIDHAELERCSWYGYYESIRKEDLLASAKVNKGYNRDAIENADTSTPDTEISETSTIFNEKEELQTDNDMVTVWKIYDMRAKRMYMFDFAVSDVLYSEEITRNRHFAIKFRNRLKGWYPLPPVFNWVSPQAEVNETREAGRIHRRRFQRKHIVREGAFLEEEFDKLQNGGDGTMVKSKISVSEAVGVMPNANLGAQHDQALTIATNDFNSISGTSAEQRGQTDRSTATQSQIKEKRSEIRESRDKEVVADFLIKIGKEILITAKQELAMPFWVKVSLDAPNLFEEVKALEDTYKLVTSDDFGDDDFEVDIKVTSISPIDQQQEKNKLVEFLSIVSQYPQVTSSPTMIQEVAERTGFRNERAIADFVRSAQLLQTLQVMQLAQQTGQDPAQLFIEQFMRNAAPGEQNPVAQRTVAQLTPPDQEKIRNQIGNQLSQPQEQ